MSTKIRQLTLQEVAALSPRTFDIAPIFSELSQYAGINGALFISETGGELSGCAAVSYRDRGLRIDHFVVVPNFRGHGLGGGLMKSVLDHAKSLGVERITAEIPGWCPEWRAFYGRFGFVFTDPKTASSLSDSTPVELLLSS